MAKDREHLAAQLLQLQTFIEKYPEKYAEIQERILKLLATYHIPMFKAGQALASRFADGLDDGIDAVIAKARELAAALEKITGGGGGGGRSSGGTRVPGLATGGYVARTGVAVVHKGETYSGVGRSLGGGQAVIDLTVNLDGEAIFRNQQKHAIRYKTANGVTGY